ncbi:putative ABC transport system permease protein [Devosia sp. YR412]|uniref:ABC transporter permease n=1 Tax=Devosia sp. YR412 TaxID=1881030 RepID=UPI0008B5450A|nr:ABC transporter permease [Devosia sp. YR412]SEP64477.1 putative ABC transport system permease protein [Devosia sp. YR412]
MSGLTFSTIELLLASGLILASAGLSLLLSLGIHRALLVAGLRMSVQLLLVGLVLRFIFESGSPWLTLALLVVMLTAASYEVGARQKFRLSGGWHFALSGAAVSTATIVVAAFALSTLASTADWTAPRVVIPIAGIVLGTAMSATSVALNALLDGIVAARNGIEAQLALGHSRSEALRPMLRKAIHAGSIPVINQMAGAGIITLPGIMSGQILAGQDPLIAAQSQIYLMFLLSGAAIASIVIAIYIAMLRLTDDRHRLRLDRLKAHP